MRVHNSFLAALMVVMSTSVAFAQEEAAQEERDPVVKETSTQASDESSEVVVWKVTGEKADAFRVGLKSAVGGEARRHLVEAKDLRARVASGFSDEVLGCFKGATPCLSAQSVALDAIDATTIIRVEYDGVRARYELVDRRGQVTRADEVEAANARDAAFAIVREIFDATATVAFETRPSGATVTIDGKAVGTTPLSHRLPIGTHTYSVVLEDHRTMRDEVTVGSGEAPVVRHDLEVLPGMVIVSDSPPGAVVVLDGSEMGPAGEAYEVAPGTYSLEVRADGYETIRDAVTVTSGGTVSRSTPMKASNILLDLTEEQILVNNYLLRFGYEFDAQNTTLLDARTDDDLPLEFAGFTRDGSLPGDAIIRETLTTNNVRIDASFAFRNFGIVLASVSYGAGTADLPGLLQRRDGSSIDATITSFRRLHVRPFQLFWRIIYGNWVPSVELGTGIVFNWFEAERADTNELETLRRTDAFWTLGLAAQYYITPNFFGNVRYSLQGYFEDAVGTDHMISLSLGLAFPNLFGFEAEPPETLEAE